MKLDSQALADLDKSLDDELRCECRCATFPDRHGPNYCPHPAAFYVEVHVFGQCRSSASQSDPNVTADGDKAAYLCRECLDSAIALAQAQLGRLPPHACCPAPPAAAGCGRPIANLDDYLPVRRPL